MTVWNCSLVQYRWTDTPPHIAGILQLYPDWLQVGTGVCDVCMVGYLRIYLASIISPRSHKDALILWLTCLDRPL
jgi:hypothetical protein